MHPRYGRAYGSKRAEITAPYQRENFMRILRAISLNGIESVAYTDGYRNTEIFASFVEKFLCPLLKPSLVVVMDNLSFHKSGKIRHIIESRGARLIFSQPYSPEFNPIEEMWSKVKSLLRKYSARTKEAFHSAITKSLCAAVKLICLGGLSMPDI